MIIGPEEFLSRISPMALDAWISFLSTGDSSLPLQCTYFVSACKEPSFFVSIEEDGGFLSFSPYPRSVLCIRHAVPNPTSGRVKFMEIFYFSRISLEELNALRILHDLHDKSS